MKIKSRHGEFSFKLALTLVLTSSDTTTDFRG